MLKYIKQCWKGEKKLREVFWIWNILVGFLLSVFVQIFVFLNLFPTALQLAFNENLEGVPFPKLALALLGIVIFLFSMVYDTWALVSLWRSAFNCSRKIYGYLARLWIVVILFFAVMVPILGEIFPGSIFEGSEDGIFIEEGPITVGPDKLPTDDEWAQIKKEMTKAEVEKIVGRSHSSWKEPDGTEKWEIWKAEINGKKTEDMAFLILPSGSVFYIYFDTTKKVIGKEKKLIPRGKIMKQIKEAEREKEKTTKKTP